MIKCLGSNFYHIYLERSVFMWSPVCDVFADDESETSSEKNDNQEETK